MRRNKFSFLIFGIVFFSVTFPTFAEQSKPGVSTPGSRLSEKEKIPPFFLGVWVSANPIRWGDLPGTEGEGGIRAICSDIANHGMNAVWVAGFDGWNAGMAHIPLWLESARQHGLKVVIQGSGGPFVLKTGLPRQEIVLHLRREVIPTWRSIAEQFGNYYPEILAYSPVQEISDDVQRGEKNALLALARLSEAVSKIDPDRPMVVVYGPGKTAIAEADAEIRGESLGAIAVNLHVFKYSQQWVNTEAPLNAADEQTREFLDNLAPYISIGRSSGVPVWVIGQAHDSVIVTKAHGERPNAKMPSEAEIRFQIWATLVSGAKGIFFFSYQSSQPPPADAQGVLEEWEISTGMWTLKGDPTPAYKSAMAMAERLRPYLALFGRFRMDTDPVRLDQWFVASRVRDVVDRTKYVILLNRDVTEVRTLKEQAAKPGTFTKPVTVLPGDAVIFRVKPEDNSLEPLPI